MAQSFSTSTTQDWKAVVARKRLQREKLIPEAWKLDVSKYEGLTNVLDVPLTCGILSKREIEITSNYDAVALLAQIQDRTFTVEEVTRAFCKRAAIAHQLTNCLTEIFFDEALERARELDRARRELPSTALPPLFGLPVSLKDSFMIPGKDATTGLAYWAEKPCTTYSALPLLLLQQGAVLYCKTNVPQTMMAADSDNNIFGRTVNPCHRMMGAGGSTGGEGALVAMRGSIMGIGTDIAGSIRIPSSANGIYGFKPSADIVPYGGQQSSRVPGGAGIIPCAGPMATSMRDCAFMLRSIMTANPAPWKYDIQCLHLPWVGLQMERSSLRIGLVEDNGVHTPTPPMRRALKTSAQKLRQTGVNLIPLRLPNVAQDIKTLWNMFAVDGSKVLKEYISISGEPLVHVVAKTALISEPGKTIDEFFKLNAATRMAHEVYKKMWLEHDLDCILMPSAPHTALPFDQWIAVSYTGIWNLQNYPACIIPVGKVDQKLDLADGLENARYGKEDAELYSLYTGPKDYRDAPTSIQIIGMRHEDEKLASISTYIDEIVNGGGKGSFPELSRSRL